MKKKIVIVFLCISCWLLQLNMVHANAVEALTGNAKAVYVMEYTSGKKIYAKNENKRLYPASMTKMMGLLLIFEGLHNGKINWNDQVTTSEHAASMGGSQVYLEVGEQLSVKELVKAICIASANDGMVAMAEYVGGSHQHFVEMMNEKAKQLHLNNTHFMNATGLHDEQHYSCAKDMAMLSKALLDEGKQDLLNITSMYDAYIRENSDKKFWLVNTNKLLKQVEGVDGLKTGFTSQALSCISVTAKRNALRLISVVMGASDSKTRNQIAKNLLEYGFSQYDQNILYKKGVCICKKHFEQCKQKQAKLYTLEDVSYVYEKGKQPHEVKKTIKMLKKQLPYKKNTPIAEMKITMSDNNIITTKLGLKHDLYPLTFIELWKQSIAKWL